MTGDIHPDIHNHLRRTVSFEGSMLQPASPRPRKSGMEMQRLHEAGDLRTDPIEHDIAMSEEGGVLRALASAIRARIM